MGCHREIYASYDAKEHSGPISSFLKDYIYFWVKTNTESARGFRKKEFRFEFVFRILIRIVLIP